MIRRCMVGVRKVASGHRITRSKTLRSVPGGRRNVRTCVNENQPLIVAYLIPCRIAGGGYIYTPIVYSNSIVILYYRKMVSSILQRVSNACSNGLLAAHVVGFSR